MKKGKVARDGSRFYKCNRLFEKCNRLLSNHNGSVGTKKPFFEKKYSGK